LLRPDLPASADYREEGCTLWRACLSCPLETCVEELPAGAASLRGKVRDLVARQMLAEGSSVTQIAAAFGVSQRAAYKIVGGVRETRRAG